MNRVTTIIAGDSTSLTDAQRKVVESAKEMQEEYKKVDREVKQLGRSADRTFRETRTETEKYNQRVGELSRLLRSGKIDQETFNRALDQARQKFGMAGDASSRAFGAGLGGMLASRITQFAGMISAVEIIRGNLARMNEEARESARNLDELFTTTGEMAQVAESDKEFRQLKSIQDQMLRAGAATTPLEAGKIALALKAAEQTHEAATAAELSRVGLTSDLEGLITSVTKLQTAFKGGDDIGNLAAIVSKAFIAGGPALERADELIAEAASAAKVAGSAGLTDEELLAATAVIGKTGASAQVLLDNFLKKVQMMEIGGDGLIEMVHNADRMMREQGQTPIQFLHDIQAVQGFNVLKGNLDEIAKLTAKVSSGNTGEELRNKIALLERENAETIEKRRQTGGLAADKMSTGVGSLNQVLDSIDLVSERLDRRLGTSPFLIGLRQSARAATRFGRFGGLPPEDFGETRVRQFEQRVDETGADATTRSLLEDLVRLTREANELARQERQRRRDAARPRVPAPETN